MNTAELLKKVRRVEIRSKRVSDRLFSGEYNSAFKGRGMAFSEVRPYQYGDDLRFIDWNVTARYNEPFIKTFQEERELTVMLLIDMSSSENFGSQAVSKREFISEIAAVLAFSAVMNNDMAGAVFFTDKVEKVIMPGKGRSHVLGIIREMLSFKPLGKGTNIASALEYLTTAVRKKCIVFLVSDYIDSGYENKLRVAARKHDVIGIRIEDPLEIELPNAGLIYVEEPETGNRFWVDTSNRWNREEYKLQELAKRQAVEAAFRKNGADMLMLRSGSAYLPELHRFFKKREARP